MPGPAPTICNKCGEFIPSGKRRKHWNEKHEPFYTSKSWVPNDHFRPPQTPEELGNARAGQTLEKDLYGKVKSEFEKLFECGFGNCYLEITANGQFTEKLKAKVREDIVFTFLKRMKGSEHRSPDITGFATDKKIGTDNLITIEFKNEPLQLWDVYQAKMYAELFNTKWGFLVSNHPIPTELKKLHRVHSIMNRFMTMTYLCLVEFDAKTGKIVHDSWFPDPPFQYDPKHLEVKEATKSAELQLRKAQIVDAMHLRLHLENVGIGWITINRYAIGGLGTKALVPQKMIEAGESGAITIPADPSIKFETGKYYDIMLWTDRGTKFSFGIDLLDPGQPP